MDRLTRFDPFADLDDMFRGLMLRPIRLEAPSPQIRIDVTENDGAYTVHAEIPGVKRDEIRVDVDQVGAKAHYSDGVLELTLPKRSRSRPSAIAIQ